MRTIGLSLLVAGLLLAVVPVSAQETGQTTFDLEGYGEGSSFYFTLAGETAKNPTLVVPAGETITINFKSVSGTHNVHVQGQDAGEYVSDGESTTYTFTAPASGSVDYWCDPHKASGMIGKVRVAGSDATPTGGDKKDSPGVQVVGVAVALVGAALFLARRN